MSTRNWTPSLIGTATLWWMPTPYCAALGVHGGENGEGPVLRVPLLRDRTMGIPTSWKRRCLRRL